MQKGSATFPHGRSRALTWIILMGSFEDIRTVVVWGDNTGGQLNVPEGLTKVKVITASGGHTVVLKEDGTIVTWGSDSYICNLPLSSASGAVSTYYHDGNRVVQMKDPEDKMITYDYNEYYNELNYQIDRNNNKITYTYDSYNGNITKITNPDSSFKEFGYDVNLNDINWKSNNNVIWERDEEGNFTIYQYDDNNKLKMKARYIKNQLTTEGAKVDFIERGKVGSNSTDFEVTEYIYDNPLWINVKIKGLLWKEKKWGKTASEDIITAEYDYYEDGTLLSIKNPETGKITKFEYNSMRLKLKETTPRNYMTKYDYDQDGRIIRITMNNGNGTADYPITKSSTTRILYDYAGRKVQVITPNLYDKTKDGLNNATPENSYLDNRVGYRYTYKSSGKLSTETDPEGNITSYFDYDSNGNLTLERKPDETVYRYEFDDLSRPIKKYFVSDFYEPNQLVYNEQVIEEFSYPKTADKASDGSYITTRVFSKHLNESAVANTTNKYDYAGREVAITNPDDIFGFCATDIVTYYKNGKIKSRKDKNGYTSYFTYDNYDGSTGGLKKRFDEKWIPVENVDLAVKYSYSRTYYDENGRVCEEWTSKLLKDYNSDMTDVSLDRKNYIIKQIGYYKDGAVNYVQYSDERRTDYYYDNDRKLSKEVKRKEKDQTGNYDVVTTEYEDNSYLGKPNKKKVHLQKRDLYGNTLIDTSDATIDTVYDYNLDGSIKTETIADVYKGSTPGHVITYNYDKLGRNTGTTEKVVDETGVEKSVTTQSDLDWQGKIKISKVIVEGIETRETQFNYYPRGCVKTIKTKYYDTKDKVYKYETTYYEYDLGGRRTCEVLPKNYKENDVLSSMNHMLYAYDNLDRVITETYSGKVGGYGNDGSWNETDATVVQKAYQYDAAGNVIKEINAEQFTEAAKNHTNLKEQIENAEGIQYKYNPLNKVNAILDAEAASTNRDFANAPVRYIYDALGNVEHEVTVREEKIPNDITYTIYESIKTYIYDEAGNILFVKVKKNSGADPVTIQSAIYDLLGNALTKTDANGNKITFTYNAFGKVRRIVTPGDVKTDPKEISIKSNTIDYQYDQHGNLKAQIDTKGTTDITDDVYNIYTYDNQNKVLSHSQGKKDGSDKILTTARYDVYGNKRFETDGNNITTEYVYNEFKRMISSKIKVNAVDNGGETEHTITKGYDLNGNLISEEAYRNDIWDHTWSYTYDGLNRLISKVNPKQEVVEKINYYIDNVQSESFDASNNKTKFEYDKNNRLIATIEPDDIDGSGSGTTRTQYDITGNIKHKEDGRTNKTYYGYDEYRRLTAVSNYMTKDVNNVPTRALETTTYEYDNNGNKTKQKNAKGETIYEYNAVNKLFRKIDNGGRVGTVPIANKTETYQYNPDGTLDLVTDRMGNKIKYKDYDTHGRYKTKIAGYNDENQLGPWSVKASYIYDGNSNQTKVTESVIRLNKDGTTTNTVTAVEREYDELNRVKKKKDSRGDNAAEADKIISTYTYDIVPSKTDLSGKTFTIEPDFTGFTAERATIKKGATPISETLKVSDNAGRLVYVVSAGKTTEYKYNERGNRTSVEYPSGSLEIYNYYKNNLLESVTNKKSATANPMDTYKYTYDKAHNQISKTEIINQVNKGQTIFDYDEVNRLKTVTAPGGTKTNYSYDEAGNRNLEKVTEPTGTIYYIKYDYNELNRLKRVEKRKNDPTTGELQFATDYVFDDNGNQKSSTQTFNQGVQTPIISKYNYDKLNRLVESDTGNYTYNGDGLRIEKTANGTLTKYIYEYDKVVLELDSNSIQTARNVYGTNLISRTISENNTYSTLYYMYNGHGDVTSLLDTSGNIVGSYYYDAFGNILESSGSMKDKNPIRYAGYQYEQETEKRDAGNNITRTGIYYLNSRVYDPTTARFLQEDTYTGDPNDPLSLNLYTYCSNEPIMYYDPSGHSGTSISGYPDIDAQIVKQMEDYYKQSMDQYYKKIQESLNDLNTVRNMSFGEQQQYYTNKELSKEQQKIQEVEIQKVQTEIAQNINTNISYQYKQQAPIVFSNTLAYMGKAYFTAGTAGFMIVGGAAIAVGSGGTALPSEIMFANALMGGGFGVGTTLAFDFAGNGIMDYSMHAYVGAAAGGMITGALLPMGSGLTGWRSAVWGGFSVAEGNMIQQYISTGNIDYRQAALAGLTGGVMTYGFNAVASVFTQQSTPYTFRQMVPNAGVKGTSSTINTAGGELGSYEKLPISSLNKRQMKIHEALKNPYDTAVLRKKDVSMNDLRQLTMVTGDEYSVFTGGGRRLVIRGKGSSVELSDKMLLDVLDGKYGKYTGHTHPMNNSILPGPVDRPWLRDMNIKESAIWGNVDDMNGTNGIYRYGVEPFMDYELNNEMRSNIFQKMFSGR